eukprot:911525-Pleurochrysis_carterae.AAC.1
MVPLPCAVLVSIVQLGIQFVVRARVDALARIAALSWSPAVGKLDRIAAPGIPRHAESRARLLVQSFLAQPGTRLGRDQVEFFGFGAVD